MTGSPKDCLVSAPASSVGAPQWQALRDVLLSVLTEHGYSVEARRSGQDLRFYAVTDDGHRWRTQILIDERHPVARLFLYLDLDYPARRRDWVLELACRVNALLAIGAFEFDWDTGSVMFRHGLDFTGQPVDGAGAARLLKVAVIALRVFTRAFAYQASGDVTPVAALDAARVAEDLADDGVASPGGRRALVRLVK